MVDFKNIKMERAHFDAELYEKWSDWCNAHGYEIIENNNCFYCEKSKAEILIYREERLAAYPDIGEQLDMIYWDKINNTNLWVEKISGVKGKYPKE
ncbi:MAG: hypothetical protein MR368_06700 [Azospirillum sp.]|nr:hypothetical protein [Azospirillum sp.]